jgi:hypothetical protein
MRIVALEAPAATNMDETGAIDGFVLEVAMDV